MLSAILSLLASLMLILPSATSVPLQGDSLWEAEFREARAATDSEFQLEILADDQITAQEYDLAIYAYLTCMADAGYPETLEPSPLIPWVPMYVSAPVATPAASPGATPIAMTDDAYFEAAMDAISTCDMEWKMQVEMLYRQIVLNPKHQDMAELGYTCAMRGNLLPDDVTKDEYLAGYRGEVEWTEDWAFTDAFTLCLINPLDISGVPYPGDPQTPVAQSAWSAEFEQARAETGSLFQQRILEDNVIEESENRLADHAFVACMEDHGVTVNLNYTHNYPGSVEYVAEMPSVDDGATPTASGEDPGVAAFNAALESCQTLWNQPVAELYVFSLTNPDKVDFLQLNLDCLHRHNLVPDDYTYQDLENAGMTGDFGEGVDSSSDEFWACLLNPLEIGATPTASPAP